MPSSSSSTRWTPCSHPQVRALLGRDHRRPADARRDRRRRRARQRRWSLVPTNREDMIDPAILRPGRLDVKKIASAGPDRHPGAAESWPTYLTPTSHQRSSWRHTATRRARWTPSSSRRRGPLHPPPRHRDGQAHPRATTGGSRSSTSPTSSAAPCSPTSSTAPRRRHQGPGHQGQARPDVRAPAPRRGHGTRACPPPVHPDDWRVSGRGTPVVSMSVLNARGRSAWRRRNCSIGSPLP